jgi:hypothetical protein
MDCILLPSSKIFPYDGTDKLEVWSMINLLAGAAYHPSPTVYLSLVAGPSFVSGQTMLGVKPSVDFYFPPNNGGRVGSPTSMYSTGAISSKKILAR